jgi:isorenieratene synthase
MTRILIFGKRLPQRPVVSTEDDWKQSSPRWIGGALQHALARPGGGWHVVDATRRFAGKPRLYRIAGRDLVFWRCNGEFVAGPDACPHMGASLAQGCVRGGKLVCSWHGLALGKEAHGAWRPLPVFDDGVLVWVRMDSAGEEPAAAPLITTRPRRYIDATIRMEAACEPEDVIANRLDPWHGVHYHPHSFRRLSVVEQLEDEITVRVAFGVLGPLAVEVDARFHCPDRRTIVMTIVGGDGEGSVVETHATPIGPGRTAVVEATLATSDRPQFALALRAARVIRPLIERAAARLWVEDIAYAERRHALRDGAGAKNGAKNGDASLFSST